MLRKSHENRRSNDGIFSLKAGSVTRSDHNLLARNTGTSLYRFEEFTGLSQHCCIAIISFYYTAFFTCLIKELERILPDEKCIFDISTRKSDQLGFSIFIAKNMTYLSYNRQICCHNSEVFVLSLTRDWKCLDN